MISTPGIRFVRKLIDREAGGLPVIFNYKEENIMNNKIVDTVKLDIVLKVTSENVSRIVNMAVNEDGISCWCSLVETEKPVTGMSIGDYIAGGGYIKLTGARDEKEYYILDRESIVDGIKKFVDTQNRYSNAVYQENSKLYLDTYNMDSEDADTIIQYALFGELRFA